MGSNARTPAASGVSGVVITPATTADIASVAEIERKAFSDPWSMALFRQALEHGAVYFALARRSGADRVLGYVVALFAAGQGDIQNVAVSPDEWGQGIGRALLDAAMAEAVVREARTIYLEVREGNARARRLYASAGFAEVGRRPAYYRHPAEDAIVLRRTLW